MPEINQILMRNLYEDVIGKLRVAKIEIPLDYNIFFQCTDLAVKEIARLLAYNKKLAVTKIIDIDESLAQKQEFEGIPIPNDYINWITLVLYSSTTGTKEARYCNIKEFLELTKGYSGDKYVNFVIANKGERMQPVFTLWGNSLYMNRTIYLYYYPLNLKGQFRYIAYPQVDYDMDGFINIPAEYYNLLSNTVMEFIYRKYGYLVKANEITQEIVGTMKYIDKFYENMYGITKLELSKVKGALKLQEAVKNIMQQ